MNQIVTIDWTLHFFLFYSKWLWLWFKVTGVWERENFCADYLTKFSIDLDGEWCTVETWSRHGIFPPIGGFPPIETSHGSFLRSVQIRWENYRVYLTCERFSESNFANLPHTSISFLHGTFSNGVNLFCFGHHHSVHGLAESTTKGSNPIITCKSAVYGLQTDWRPFCMRINNVPQTCKLMTASLKDLTRKAAHHLVVNLILSCRTCKRQESTSVGIDASVKNKWKFWRWLKEKVETGLCLARFASRRCVWVTASKRSMCRVRLSVPGVMRYGPINQHFVWLFFCFKFTSYYFDIGQFRLGNEDSLGNENRKSWKKQIFCRKKSISILFSLWKFKW